MGNEDSAGGVAGCSCTKANRGLAELTCLPVGYGSGVGLPPPVLGQRGESRCGAAALMSRPTPRASFLGAGDGQVASRNTSSIRFRSVGQFLQG